MRKIGIVGGTGIENPDTLKGFETKIIEHSCPGTGWIIPWRPT